MSLDIDFVRQQFPQCADYPELVFCSNAGGSYVAQQVIDIQQRYNSHTRVQPYSAFTPSREAGEAMDRARRGWAEALNIDISELTIGPSTSSNAFVMAQALGASWKPGDEIIVSQQDHEANIGAWRRKAREKGATIIEWPLDPATGLLDPAALYPLLNDNTRWVFFTHCSNLMGTVNPVAEIVRQVRALSPARVCVDAVAYAPHHIPDLQALDVDLYLFSLYKVFGPHQGVLYVKKSLSGELQGQGHYFNREDPGKRYNPAGPQHAQIAACQGVLDYFAALYQHHGGGSQDSALVQMAGLHRLLVAQETRLAEPMLDYLGNSPKVQLLGKPHCRDGDRAPTVAFRPLQQSPSDVARRMQEDGIGTESGHFYAPRALRHMGIDPEVGVVRLSLVHYNHDADVQRVLASLDAVL